MQGLMQDVPLTINHLFDRAEKYFGHKTITTATATGVERTTYREWAARTRKLAGVLDGLGIDPDRGVVRLSFVHYTSPADVERAVGALADAM